MLRGTPRSRRNGPRAAPRARVRSYARARGSAAGPRSGRTDRSWRSPSDDPSAPEIGEPLRRVPERLAVDLRVVLAEPRREGERRRVADRRRGQRGGEAGARVSDVDEPRRHQRVADHVRQRVDPRDRDARFAQEGLREAGDRKSTRLNSSHRTISYAVFCLKKKKNKKSRLNKSQARTLARHTHIHNRNRSSSYE